eukprot:4417592-Pyramimonas_sp.AAC.1
MFNTFASVSSAVVQKRLYLPVAPQNTQKGTRQWHLIRSSGHNASRTLPLRCSRLLFTRNQENIGKPNSAGQVQSQRNVLALPAFRWVTMADELRYWVHKRGEAVCRDSAQVRLAQVGDKLAIAIDYAGTGL